MSKKSKAAVSLAGALKAAHRTALLVDAAMVLRGVPQVDGCFDETCGLLQELAAKEHREFLRLSTEVQNYFEQKGT